MTKIEDFKDLSIISPLNLKPSLTEESNVSFSEELKKTTENEKIPEREDNAGANTRTEERNRIDKGEQTEKSEEPQNPSDTKKNESVQKEPSQKNENAEQSSDSGIKSEMTTPSAETIIKIVRGEGAAKNAEENFTVSKELNSEKAVADQVINSKSEQESKDAVASEEFLSTETTDKSSETRTDELASEQLLSEKNDSQSILQEKNSKTTDIKAGNKPETMISQISVNETPENSVNEIKTEKQSSVTPELLIAQYKELSDKIMQNVSNSVKFLLSGKESTVSIKLYPPELGRVDIQLHTKGNSAEAKINTENSAVKEVILTHLQELKSSVQETGFNINKVSVEVGGFKNFHESSANSSSGERNKRRSGGGSESTGTEGASENSRKPHPLTMFIGRSVNLLT